jgi:polyphosphate kinase
VLFPVQDRRIIRYLTDDVLKTYLAANTKTRILQPDGAYQHIKPEPGEQSLNPQEWLIHYHQRSKSW